ncbi:MAG: periplasmic heavy metal sensor [Acidobacteriota bacterium]
MTTRMMPMFAILGVALAQGPMGPGGMPPAPQFTELKAYLNLTDTQIQQIQQAQRQAMERVQIVVTQIPEKQKALRDLLDKGTTDAAAVGKLVLEIEALHKQVTQAREAGHVAALAVLTTAQKDKLKTLEEAAKLQPVIHQAAMLALLVPPVPQPGLGPGGPGGPMGPMGRGARRGFGPPPGESR